MPIIIKHHDGERPSFDVGIAKTGVSEPYITIKGCRVVDGQKGRFISWPAKKLDSGKYWNHVYATEDFVRAVLQAHDESRPKLKAAPPQPDDDDIPF